MPEVDQLPLKSCPYISPHHIQGHKFTVPKVREGALTKRTYRRVLRTSTIPTNSLSKSYTYSSRTPSTIIFSATMASHQQLISICLFLLLPLMSLPAASAQQSAITACRAFLATLSFCSMSSHGYTQAQQEYTCVCDQPSQFDSLIQECYDWELASGNQDVASSLAEFFDFCGFSPITSTATPTNIQTFTIHPTIASSTGVPISHSVTSPTSANSYGTRLLLPVWGYCFILLTAMLNSLKLEYSIS